ncbi:MAG: Diaminopimelate epimerase 2 [Candidatus Anoxychlamydiales bacterium]|nr:Diaminopimelate epimerase 2 [Candidatus Anoxychlamydiales bacterium]
MMKSNKAIKFFKYSGFGNDFILFDHLQSEFNKKSIDILKLCDRNFGIGSDGIIYLSKQNNLYKMDIYNRDASKATMCGNALISLTKHIIDSKYESNNFQILTDFGLYDVGEIEDKYFFISSKPKVLKLNHQIQIDDMDLNLHIINSGNFHACLFVKNLKEINIEEIAKKIRNSKSLKHLPLNVNFIEMENNNINVRVFENGLNKETLACGTGALAVSYVIKKLFNKGKLLKINFLKGEYEIDFSYKKNKVKFISNASFVFFGEIVL